MRSISRLAAGLLLLAAAANVSAATTVPAEEEKILNIYNWSDYIAEDTISNFEKETGIRVVYDTFDDIASLNASIASDTDAYDLVVPSLQELSGQLQAGRFQALDKSRLSNYGNLDPQLLAQMARLDPGNAYSVNWLWGTTGIGYNVAKVRAALGPDAPVNSWDLLFKPENLSKLKSCGVAVIDRPGELLPIALNYLGEDPNSTDEQVIRKGESLLSGIRPYITAFDSFGYINALANGEICVAVGWSGDVFMAATRAGEAGKGIQIKYAVPKEGAPMWFDIVAIPKHARHPANAHAFLNYILRPEVMVDISAYSAYANANKASTPLVDKRLLEDPGVYPAPETMQRMFVLALLPEETTRLYASIWSKLKAQ